MSSKKQSTHEPAFLKEALDNQEVILASDPNLNCLQQKGSIQTSEKRNSVQENIHLFESNIIKQR